MAIGAYLHGRDECMSRNESVTHARVRQFKAVIKRQVNSLIQLIAALHSFSYNKINLQAKEHDKTPYAMKIFLPETLLVINSLFFMEPYPISENQLHGTANRHWENKLFSHFPLSKSFFSETQFINQKAVISNRGDNWSARRVG